MIRFPDGLMLRFREGRLRRDGALTALRALRRLDVNYPEPPPGAAPVSGWHFDSRVQPLPPERAGAPAAGGTWETACRLVRDYQFADPRILLGLYDTTRPLLGRDMLLDARFYGLRFELGVRVTSCTDTTRGTGENARRVWGWGYQTLEGHLEEGELAYEVVKHLATGEVDFVITAHSRRAPIRNPLIRLGFMLFGRLTQRRFYRRSGRRLRRLVLDELRGGPPSVPEPHPGDGDVVIVPGGRGDVRGTSDGSSAPAPRAGSPERDARGEEREEDDGSSGGHTWLNGA